MSCICSFCVPMSVIYPNVPEKPYVLQLLDRNEKIETQKINTSHELLVNKIFIAEFSGHFLQTDNSPKMYFLYRDARFRAIVCQISYYGTNL